jgi:hypothetical protein
MDPLQERLRNLSRRHFFKRTGLAAGSGRKSRVPLAAVA